MRGSGKLDEANQRMVLAQRDIITREDDYDSRAGDGEYPFPALGA